LRKDREIEQEKGQEEGVSKPFRKPNDKKESALRKEA
jgi:hypothetical protein